MHFQQFCLVNLLWSTYLCSPDVGRPQLLFTSPFEFLYFLYALLFHLLKPICLHSLAVNAPMHAQIKGTPFVKALVPHFLYPD